MVTGLTRREIKRGRNYFSYKNHLYRKNQEWKLGKGEGTEMIEWEFNANTPYIGYIISIHSVSISHGSMETIS